MKPNLLILAGAAAAAAAAGAARAADVGVSISVAQPGFYGRVDIGDFPRPALIYAEPMIVQPMPPGIVRRPIYLHVPPGHAKDWRKHCSKYGACGQPVYFVQERWYNEVYVPQQRSRPGSPRRFDDDHGGRGRGYDDDRGRLRSHDDDRARGRGQDDGRGRGRGSDDDRGQGRGRGHDKDHGHGKGRQD